MKNLPRLIGCLVLLATIPGAFAATPATNAPPDAPVPAIKETAPTKPTLKLDDFVNELAATIKLTDEEKKEIANDYRADGVVLKNILNNDSLPPVQKVQQVFDLRDARNAKIEALLQDVDRKKAFLKIEATYRVALTELAANGGLVPAEPTPPVPAPVPSDTAPSPTGKADKSAAKQPE